MKAYLLAALLLAVAAQAQEQAQKPPAPQAQPVLRVCSKECPPPCAKFAPKIKKETQVDPEYSEEARMNRINATVVMWIVVKVDGNVGDVTVEKKAGYGLDEKAVAAVKQWRFEPGRLEDGTPVAVKVQASMTFRLR